jgi:hypothetical protein
MPSALNSRSFQLGGYTFSNPSESAVTFDHPNVFVLTPNLAYPLSAWVKTDADTAAGNLTNGHGQTTGVFDVYWVIASVYYVRYGVTCTITTNAVALEGGTGDAFPATADATVTICKQISAVTYIDGDNVKIIGCFLDNASDTAAQGHLDMQDSGNATIEELDLAASGTAKMAQIYDIANGASNVFTGNVITQTKISQSSITAAGTIYILVGEDATP